MATGMIRLGLGVAMAALTVGGCSSQPEIPDTSYWRLVEMLGAPPIAGSEITLTLDQTRSRVTGTAGCNRYQTGYGGDLSAPTFSMAGLTKKMCHQPDGIMEQERKYVELLRTATRFDLDEREMVLQLPEGTLRFERVVMVDR
jgi:heat shock protein HslJ